MAGEDGGGLEVAVTVLEGNGSEKTAVKAARSSDGRKMSVMLALAMVMVQVFTVVMMILSKLALRSGMHPIVLIVYRNLIGAAVVAPLAVVFERDMMKKVNLVVLGWISINATFGVVLAMGLYYYGLRATNASYAVNFLNLIPMVTFIIAIALGAERLMLSKWAGRTKLLGTLLSVCGAMLVSLLHGKLLHLWPTHLLSVHGAAASRAAPHQDMVAGTLFLCGSCVSYALWYIVQVRLGKMFPSKYWATALTCLSGSLQSAVVGLAMSTDRSAWRVGWDLQLATVVYSGVFTTAAAFLLISWAVARRGPLYPPMFNSLSLIATTVADSVLLGTSIYVGGVLGTLTIVVGLYAFLWGKGQELSAAAAATQKNEKLASDELAKAGDVARI